jgi:hypothetical protein
MLIRRSMLAVCLAARLSAAAQSQLYGTLKGTPAEVFDDEDRRLFGEASKRRSTRQSRRGRALGENPRPRAGELKVLSTFDWKNAPCRKIRVSNEARGRKATNDFQLLPRRREVEGRQPLELNKS